VSAYVMGSNIVYKLFLFYNLSLKSIGLHIFKTYVIIPIST